jgi:hypothetical protein
MKLVLCRSDKGDGGWSLHEEGSTDEAIASGEAPPLATGIAWRTPDGWSRPDFKDYAVAYWVQASARHRRGGY